MINWCVRDKKSDVIICEGVSASRRKMESEVTEKLMDSGLVGEYSFCFGASGELVTQTVKVDKQVTVEFLD